MSNLLARTANRRSAPSRRSRAGLAAAAVLVATAPLLAACGAGFNATTQNFQLGPGNGQVGAVRINNVWVVIDPKSGKAEVIGAVTNTGTVTDRVTSVKVGDTVAQATGTGPFTVNSCRGVSLDSGNTVIPGGNSVSFGQRDCPKLALPGASFEAGRATPVTVTLARAGSLTVNALIMPNTGLFAEYNLNGDVSPTATAPAKPTDSPTAEPVGTATPTPGATSGTTLTGATATATATGTATATATANANAAANAKATPSPSASASASAHKNTSASATR